MQKVILFGTGKVADTVYHYFSLDPDIEIGGFCVDKAYLRVQEFHGLPVVEFENVNQHFPPEDYAMFIAIGYNPGNALRKSRFEAAKRLGYDCMSYIHPWASLIGIKAIGENCLVLDGATLQPGVTLGDNVFIWSQAMIGHHATIDSHTWVNSGCVVSGSSHLQEGCYLGVNACIGHEITIGEGCFVGANSLVTKNAEAFGVYISADAERIRLNTEQFFQISQMAMNS